MPHWGISTWIFFHTLAAKVKPDKYECIKIELLQYIKSLCNILPCPDCAEHATAYMKLIHIQYLPTSESFKQMLFDFHNRVNLRLKKQIYTYDYLTIYDNLNFYIIYHAFSREFTKPLHNTRFIADNMFRKRKLLELKEWIIKNKHCFNI